MIDFLKKAVKPVATAAMIFIGLGAVTAFSDSKNWKDLFNVYVEPPVGPWHTSEFFRSAKTDENGAIILHADELRQLRWMTVAQLRAIFNGRRDKFQVENSPAAYQELRWMTTAQIEAIFGKTDIP